MNNKFFPDDDYYIIRALNSKGSGKSAIDSNLQSQDNLNAESSQGVSDSRNFVERTVDKVVETASNVSQAVKTVTDPYVAQLLNALKGKKPGDGDPESLEISGDDLLPKKIIDLFEQSGYKDEIDKIYEAVDKTGDSLWSVYDFRPVLALVYRAKMRNGKSRFSVPTVFSIYADKNLASSGIDPKDLTSIQKSIADLVACISYLGTKGSSLLVLKRIDGFIIPLLANKQDHPTSQFALQANKTMGQLDPIGLFLYYSLTSDLPDDYLAVDLEYLKR